ncbi:MAG TPA: phasin family protein [Rhizobacter sp.]
MASRNPKASARAGATQAASLPLMATAESTGFALAQEQMQSLMTLADTVLKRAEELRQCQLEAAQLARRRHDRARADVASAANPSELLRAQADLLRDDLESASQYWQRMATICTAAQAEALEQLTRAAGQFGRVAASAAAPARPAPSTDTTPEPIGSAEATQAWNRWMEMGKQWSDMLYRTEAALH